jgi:hypothetical protein
LAVASRESVSRRFVACNRQIALGVRGKLETDFDQVERPALIEKNNRMI